MNAGQPDGSASPPHKRLAVKPDPLGYPASGSSLWNLPNELTMLRLVLVIPFAWLLISYGNQDWARITAAFVFVVAAITDFLDGALARRRNLVTTFGKIADPIADKALTGSALIILSWLGDLSWWVTIVILAREVIVTAMRFWVIQYAVISASRGGKAKTVAQLMAIFLYLLPLTGVLATGRAVIMAVAVVLTVLTGLDYAVRAVRVREKGKRIARDL